MLFDDPNALKVGLLYRAKPESVVRLAKYLHLQDVEAMSNRQLCRLVAWLLRRRMYRDG
jgi:hypothetical protein